MVPPDALHLVVEFETPLSKSRQLGFCLTFAARQVPLCLRFHHLSNPPTPGMYLHAFGII
jgi:hypothetical protein